MTGRSYGRWTVAFLLGGWLLVSGSAAASDKSWYDNLSPEWGGHLRLRGMLAWPDDESVYNRVGTGTWIDGAGELRLKNRLFFSDWGIFETHYELFLSGGDTREKGRELARILPERFDGGLELSGTRPIDDNRRLLDLTEVIDEEEQWVLYHRLDRLFLTLRNERGTLRLGRQALTWGTGMLFNPMDLFNPFAPTDVDRDYKVGDDMATARISLGSTGELALLYVPRRNPETGDVEWDSSALAGKYHLIAGTTEYDLMAARNYRNTVFGAGAVGYLGGAAWRTGMTWTGFPSERNRKGYFAVVGNIDYSWVWWQKNFYGFLEAYYNTLGDDTYSDAVRNPDLMRALERGTLFTLGRLYLAGQVMVEIHPLFSVYLTVIQNIRDPSAVFQPRCIWSMTQNMELMAGATIFTGGPDTEYGGFTLPESDIAAVPADHLYIWLTWYF